jgi:hypothetical protein
MGTTASRGRRHWGVGVMALALAALLSACATGANGLDQTDAGGGPPVDANRPPQVDAAQADAAQTDAAQADGAQADAVQTDAVQADAVQADAAPCQGAISSFQFDFEGGWQGWTTGMLTGNGCESSNEWEQGTPSSAYWPQQCAGGTGCIGTDLDDHYNYNECSYARSPALDLSSCVGTPVCLKFDLAYDFLEMYGDCVDGCVVQVNVTDDVSGDSWVSVTPDGDYPFPMPTSHQLPATQRAFCGKVDWSTYTVHLDDAVKKAAFRVRFYMDNGDEVSHFGAYVDNVKLVECP